MESQIILRTRCGCSRTLLWRCPLPPRVYIALRMSPFAVHDTMSTIQTPVRVFERRPWLNPDNPDNPVVVYEEVEE